MIVWARSWYNVGGIQKHKPLLTILSFLAEEQPEHDGGEIDKPDGVQGIYILFTN